MTIGRRERVTRFTADACGMEACVSRGDEISGKSFYDLLHIHMNDEVDRVARYDYDHGNPRRKQVQSLPPFETTVDPCFTYDGTNAMSLIRMPFWARWNAARIGFNQDWSPVRLVIGPEIK